MPELPEIEALRETLAHRVAGRRPMSISVRQFALVKTVDPPLEDLVEQALVGARRHGKHLLLDFESDLTLAIHLGIGGRLLLEDAMRKQARSLSLEMQMDDGNALRVAELGTKKRSSVHLLRAAAVVDHLSHLGVDALSRDVTVDVLAGLLAKDRSQLKHFLEDQRRVAGIGNAYSDEILFEARIDPFRKRTTMSDDDIGRLYRGLRTVYDWAIPLLTEHFRDELDYHEWREHLKVHRKGAPEGAARDEGRCPRCGTHLTQISPNDRVTTWCRTCQT